MTYKKFESVKLRIMKGRKLRPFPTARVIQDHEDRIKALEGNTDNDTIYDDTSLAGRVSQLESFFTRTLTFTINDGTDPIEGATVSIDGKTGTTGSAGGCSINGVLDGTYEVEVSKDGYVTATESITSSSDTSSFTISLVAST